jgi:hypothetical protein
VTCTVCSRPIDGASIADREVNVHAECVPAGLVQDAVLTVVETIAVVIAPAVIVWAS